MTTIANGEDGASVRAKLNAALVVTDATSGTNTGDQTSVVGITGTKAQFDTAVTDGNILFVGDVTQYTDELAQDAVGGMVDTSLTYVDATPLLQRAALTGAVTASAGSNSTALGSFNLAALNTALSDADVATGGGTASGTNTGDQTSIVGITGTLAQFDTACTDANFLSVAAAAAAYQPLDTQLTDVSSLVYATNALKVIRVNAGETQFELATISGGSLADADYGDITVSGSGTVMTIDADVVTYAKMQNVSAASRLLGRGDSGSGDVQELTIGAGLAITGTELAATGSGGGLARGVVVAQANFAISL